MKRRVFLTTTGAVSISGCVGRVQENGGLASESDSANQNNSGEPEVFEDTEPSVQAEQELTFGEWYTDSLFEIAVQVNGYRVKDYIFGEDEGATIDGSIRARKIPNGKWFIIEQKIKKLGEDGKYLDEATVKIGSDIYSTRTDNGRQVLYIAPAQYYNSETDSWENDVNANVREYELPMGGGVDLEEKGAVEQVWRAIDIPASLTVESPVIGYNYGEESGWSASWTAENSG